MTIGHDAAKTSPARTPSSSVRRSIGATPNTSRATRLGIPLLHRGEMLAQLLARASRHRGLRHARQDDDDGDDARGPARRRHRREPRARRHRRALGSNAHDGTSPWFVTEADESDGSFALLEPAIAVVTNVENDHLTSDDELPRARSRVRRVSGATARRRRRRSSASTTRSPPRWRPHDLRARDGDVRPRVRAPTLRAIEPALRRARLAVRRASPASAGSARSSLRVPGAINVQNALAAVAVGMRTRRCRSRSIAEALRGVRGRAPAFRRARLVGARMTRRRRLRAPPDGGARDDRGGAPLPSRPARRSLSAAPLLAHGVSRARFRRRAARRRPRLSRAGLRGVGAGDSRRERTLDRRPARARADQRRLRAARRGPGRPHSRRSAARRDRPDARRRQHHRRRGALACRLRRPASAPRRSARERDDRAARCARCSTTSDRDALRGDLRRPRAPSTSRSRRTRRGRSAVRPTRW